MILSSARFNRWQVPVLVPCYRQTDNRINARTARRQGPASRTRAQLPPRYGRLPKGTISMMRDLVNALRRQQPLTPETVEQVVLLDDSGTER